MEKEQIKKIYSRYSSVYDFVFSQLFLPRIKLGIEKIGIKKGDRIIEIGIGTGISLSLYPDFCNVVGIDITRKMLSKAKAKKEKLKLGKVHLFEMDAENLTFNDNSFDHALMPFVISVVPNLEKVMSEVKRVTKNNGKIVIINHLCSQNPLLSRFEKFITPLSMRLGWRSDISLNVLSNHCKIHIKEVTKKTPFDPWYIINAVNIKE
ncbi:MAG: class I SAM-dependent methyltransferase [Syntrophorhabdaceae bacterium]|nr:class I SAM-dependent methyltransferase [Syntrophorhabdaceae bacterium]